MAPKPTFPFKADIWIYPGEAGWHFVTVPKTVSARIKKQFGDRARGWGSLPVRVTLGAYVWKTSIFPDAESGTYLLPLKADIRKRAKVYAADTVRLVIELLV